MGVEETAPPRHLERGTDITWQCFFQGNQRRWNRTTVRLCFFFLLVLGKLRCGAVHSDLSFGYCGRCAHVPTGTVVRRGFE